MAVTHDPAGFTGTVDQIDEARRFAFGGGGRFKVASSSDWAPSASGSVNRTVNIAAGSGVACGVFDITTASDSVAFAANSGGTDRFDAIVATFDWSALTVSFRVIQGTTVVPTIVKTGSTVDAAKINWLPGLRYDAVLAVVRVRSGVTLLAPADLYDCRPYGAWNSLAVATATYSSVLDIDAGAKFRAVDTGVTWESTGSAFFLRDVYNTTTIAGVAVPSGARIIHLRRTEVTNITNTSGGFNVPYGMTFVGVLAVSIAPGDNTGNMAFVVPIAGNHTTSTANGIAFQSTGAVVANTTPVRIEMDVVGYV